MALGTLPSLYFGLRGLRIAADGSFWSKAVLYRHWSTSTASPQARNCRTMQPVIMVRPKQHVERAWYQGEFAEAQEHWYNPISPCRYSMPWLASLESLKAVLGQSLPLCYIYTPPMDSKISLALSRVGRRRLKEYIFRAWRRPSGHLEVLLNSSPLNVRPFLYYKINIKVFLQRCSRADKTIQPIKYLSAG